MFLLSNVFSTKGDLTTFLTPHLPDPLLIYSLGSWFCPSRFLKSWVWDPDAVFSSTWHNMRSHCYFLLGWELCCMPVNLSNAYRYIGRDKGITVSRFTNVVHGCTIRFHILTKHSFQSLWKNTPFLPSHKGAHFCLALNLQGAAAAVVSVHQLLPTLGAAKFW